MLNAKKETELLEALQKAEQTQDGFSIDKAVNLLALYYVVTEQFSAAIPFWRRGAEFLAASTAPDSRELATYLHNMAFYCLIPAGMRDEAYAVLTKARELYQRHFGSDDQCVKDVDELLKLDRPRA
jgi:tetratricopeptide (TPR) repeat protein